MRWRIWVLVGLTAAMVGLAPGVAAASCQVPHESTEYVVGLLTGADVEGFVFTDPGSVLAVVEKETVKRWDSIPTHTAASATVVTRYWGEPPASVFDAVIDGGEPTRAPDTTISCDPSQARELGETELGAVFDRVGYVPLWDGVLTAEQEAAIVAGLGPEVPTKDAVLPAEHPRTSAAGSEFGDVDDVDTTPWVAIVGAAVLVVGLVGVVLRRRGKSDGDLVRSRTSEGPDVRSGPSDRTG